MNQPERKPRFANARGMGLVEIIVTVVLLSVGLLALARLQFGSQAASTVSLQRTLAQVQALDMSERMWLDLRAPLSCPVRRRSTTTRGWGRWAAPQPVAAPRPA